MATSTHSSSSMDVGTGYAWILDHLTIQPGTYQMPLRVMWDLNAPGGELSTQQQQQQRQASVPGTPQSTPGTSPGGATSTRSSSASSSSSTASTSPTPSSLSPLSTRSTPSHLHDPRDIMASMHANLMHRLGRTAMPSGANMPLTSLVAFVRECLPPDLAGVRFSEGLTCLDYLRDIDQKRRREFQGVLIRLGIDLDADGHAPESGRARASKKRSPVDEWIHAAVEKARDVEAQYTQVYIGIRHWMMISELSTETLDKAKALAMLNTLYPPVMIEAPTKYITAAVLQEHRNGFIQRMRDVERQGPKALGPAMRLGMPNRSIHANENAKKQEETGWPFVAEVVDQYLSNAQSLIEECASIIGVESVLQRAEDEAKKRKSRKADSGVSFASSDGRPSTSGSRQLREKPLPPSPTDLIPSPLPISPIAPTTPSSGMTATTTTSTTRPTKPSNAFEKIVREFRKFSIGSSGTGGEGRSRSRSKSKDDSDTAISPTSVTDSSARGMNTDPFHEPASTSNHSNVTNIKTESRSFARSLKKMKSTPVFSVGGGDRSRKIGGGGGGGGGVGGGHGIIPAFNLDDETRRKAIQAALNRGQPVSVFED